MVRSASIDVRNKADLRARVGLGGVNGACVVDTKHLNDFTYDAQDHTISFGPGNRLRDLTKKLKPTGRTMAYGAAGDVGTGGHITIGGLGVLGRQLGLAADQIVKVECVLGNGTIATATATTNSDLFFAIRGAGFSFAIVTEFKAQTAPAPGAVTQFAYNITAGKISDLADTFKAWQKYVTQPNLPRTFGCTLTLLEGVLVFSGTYFGSEQEFNKLNLEAILPGAKTGLHVTSSIATKLFNDIEDFGLDLTGGISAHFYSKNIKTTNRTLYSDQAADTVFNYIDKADKGSPLWFVIWDLNGGRIADTPQMSSAYWHRDAVYFLQSYIVNLTGDVSKTSKDFLAGLNRVVQQQTGADDSAYPGYVDDELPNPQRSYWGGNVPRLQDIKARVDPDNVYRNPQTIMARRASS